MEAGRHAGKKGRSEAAMQGGSGEANREWAAERDFEIGFG